MLFCLVIIPSFHECQSVLIAINIQSASWYIDI